MNKQMGTVVYGNGSMARVLYSYAREKLNVCAFTVDDECIGEGENTFCGLPLVPFSEIANVFPPDAHKMIVAVGYSEMNELRQRKSEQALGMGYEFVSYIHDSFTFHDLVKIGVNTIILDFVSVHAGTTIGDNTFISSNVNIGHDCNIGANNWINSGVSIAGGASISENCFFGVNSSVGHKVVIGKRNFIGANTLVAQNTSDDDVYYSEPPTKARLKSKTFLKFSR